MPRQGRSRRRRGPTASLYGAWRSAKIGHWDRCLNATQWGNFKPLVLDEIHAAGNTINIAGCRLRVGADPALDDRDRFPGRRGFGIDLEAAQISIKRRPARSGIARSRVFNVAEHAAGSQASGPSGRSHGHSQNILERYAPGLREARAIPANMRMVSLPAQCCASVYGAGGAATSASPASASAAMIRLQARSVAAIFSMENWNTARSPRLLPGALGLEPPRRRSSRWPQPGDRRMGWGPPIHRSSNPAPA